MNRFYILVLVLFGFLLMPNSTFACGNKSEKHCKKETTSKTEKKSCCDKSDSKKGCGGKCGHSKCGCPSSVITAFNFSGEIHFKTNNFDFISEKQKFSNSETFISSGFYSLWLIPKIS